MIISVKHYAYGIGQGTIYEENGKTLIKVVFSDSTTIFDYNFAFSNRVLELANPNDTLPIPLLNTKKEKPENSTKIQGILAKYVKDFENKKDLPFIVKNSIPIVWFGDLQKYLNSKIKILTIGLNPSDNEFPFPKKRFVTPINFNEPDSINRLEKTLNNYFNDSPLEWFKKYNKLLHACDCCYACKHFDIKEFTHTAIHIDIYSAIATNPTIGKLTPIQKGQLQNTLLSRELFDFLSPDLTLISVNKIIFEKFFAKWNTIAQYKFDSMNSIIVKELKGKFVINGTNMLGVPFGGIKEIESKKIIAEYYNRI